MATAIAIIGGFGALNGVPGVFLGILIVAVLGAFLPLRPIERDFLSDTDDPKWEKIEPARKGRNADPTRPDDHPLMLTREVRRRK